MQHQHELTGMLWAVNFIANLGIVGGYMLVPFTVLRYLALTRSVTVSGTLFFLTCALTHLAMAVGFTYSPLMVINHVVQFGAVVWFVLGFFQLLRQADARINPPPLKSPPGQDLPHE